MFEKYKLVLIGSIGYDVCIVGENNKIIFSPGGFAWHSACGVLSINGKADVLANITNGFNKELLSHFSESDVRLVLNHAKDKFENAYIFDFSSLNYTIGISYSEGLPSLKFSQLFDKEDDSPKLVHIGTTNPSTIWDRIDDINSLGLTSIKFSSNLYLPYLNEKSLDCIKQIVSHSSIIFLNIEELNKLKDLGELKLLEDKLLVVTCGKKGVAFFVKNNLKFMIPPKKRIEVSAIGAGDVLLGSFLGGITKGLDFELSLALANEVASMSVTDYGTTHLTQIRTPIAIEQLRSQVKVPEKSVNLKEFKV